jgi:hypothetical protein
VCLEDESKAKTMVAYMVNNDEGRMEYSTIT